MQRIGVFVCHCGTNIAGTVDVKAVAEALAHEPGVVFSTDYQYMCSQAGQNMIRDAIKEHNLGGIVICSCSPRMHEATFRKTAAAAGLNPYMVEIANIREQCSWVHKDMPGSGKGQPQHTAYPRRKSRHQAGARYRRRYCRYPDGA